MRPATCFSIKLLVFFNLFNVVFLLNSGQLNKYVERNFGHLQHLSKVLEKVDKVKTKYQSTFSLDQFSQLLTEKDLEKYGQEIQEFEGKSNKKRILEDFAKKMNEVKGNLIANQHVNFNARVQFDSSCELKYFLPNFNQTLKTISFKSFNCSEGQQSLSLKKYVKTDFNMGTGLVTINLDQLNKRNLLVPKSITLKGKEGYFQDLYINGQKIDLWYFKEKNGNCIIGKTLEDSTGAFFENGFQTFGEILIDNRIWNFKLNIKTFDENSLIYLGLYNASFIGLYLKEGKLQFSLRSHILNKTYEIATSTRCNDGKSHQIELGGNKNLYELKVDKESFEVETKKIIRIKDAIHYVGGLGEKKNNISLPFNKNSFLGIIRFQEIPFLKNISHYGISNRNNLQFFNAFFDQPGYLKLLNIEAQEIELKIRPFSKEGLIIALQGINKQIPIFYKNESIFGTEIDGELPLIIPCQYNQIHLNNDNFFNFFQENPIFNVTFGSYLNFPKYSGGISDIFFDQKPYYFEETSKMEFKNVQIGREPMFNATNSNCLT